MEMDCLATARARDECDLTNQTNIDTVYALDNITYAMQNLGSTSPVTRIDLNFTQDDHHILEQFKMTNLTKRIQHTFCIPQLNCLEKGIAHN